MLIAVALFGQVLGFLRNRLVSTNFTQVDPGSTDAFFAAFQIPDFFFLTIAAGALGVAFMPILADRLEKGDRQSVWELTSSLLNLLTLVMLFVALIIFIFADPLIGRIVAPKLDPEHHHQAVTIMRLVALNPLFFTLSGIITSMQQTFGRFFFYAMAPLFYNLAIIFSIYVFKDNLGVIGLGVGALIGAVLQLVIACFGLVGLEFKYRPKIIWRSSHFKQILRQLPARSVDQGIDSINSIVEINRAILLGQGPASYYTYATTLHNVPISLIGTSISTAAFPRLTERLSQNRPDLFRRDFLKILRTMIWISMPVVVICYFCRGYLARLLFGDVAPEVALIFGFLTVAILFRIIYSIVSRYFYAQKDTKTPLYISLFAIAFNIFLAYFLSRPSSYGVSGLAMAQSIVATSEVVILVGVMTARDHKLLDREFWGGCVRILSVTGFSILTSFIMVSFLPLKIADRGFVTLGAKLGIIAGATLTVHVLISAIMGLEEVRPVLAKMKQIVLKPIRVDF